MSGSISSSIPVSQIVSVVPSVISGGGTQLALVGLALSNTTRVPIGQVLSFPTLASVQTYFGATSNEALQAAVYFGGYTGGTKLPGSLLMTQYPTAPVGAFLRGGNISSMTLAALQALNSTLTVTIDAVVKTGTVNLSAATSFSSAATIIQTALTLSVGQVTYDSVSGAFVVASGTTGAASTITVGTGAMATSLLLTTATGAVLSQGAIAAVPGSFMASIIATTTNWATFFTLFDPDAGAGNAQKQLFAAWVNSTNNEFVYICQDTDVTPTLSTAATTSLGYLLKQSASSGTFPIYSPLGVVSYSASFISGFVASLNTNATNGRATAAFRTQSGLVPGVTTPAAATNLMANGYNFYGGYALNANLFNLIYPGSITGPFLWLDSYVNQILLNSQCQLALMIMLTAYGTVPYNPTGYGYIRAALADPVAQGLNFGTIRANVPLSAAETSLVNSIAGFPIDAQLSTRGWYLVIQPATAQTRAARQSPTVILFYMDGQSVQQINLSSILVQ